MDTPQASLNKTPLHDRHVALGARMVPFAGYDMPVQYSGIIDEHMAVRQAAGLFDVSHMGEIEVLGPRAAAACQRLTTNDVRTLASVGSRGSDSSTNVSACCRSAVARTCFSWPWARACRATAVRPAPPESAGRSAGS